METFIAILHIVVALVLISLVLVQDSKSGSVGGAFGGGGSSSVLGATGATTLAQNMTRWTAVLFAVTCILLTIFSNRKSVMDSVVLPPPTTLTAPMNAAAAVSGSLATATTTSTTTTLAPVKR